jgi:F-type H+-transporting ATPase subunit b
MTAIVATAVAAIMLTFGALAWAQEHGEHGAAPANGEEHAAAGEHHGSKELNLTDVMDKERPAIIALLINFGLLVGLYYTMGKKPIAEALKQRKITIAKEIEEARKMLEEAEERAKKYQGDLKNADADAADAKAALIAAGKGEVDRMLLEAQEKAERMKRDAERLVEQERKQVHEDLLRETVDLAVVEAMKVLERSVTPDDHARLAQDLLTELAARPATQRGAS